MMLFVEDDLNLKKLDKSESIDKLAKLEFESTKLSTVISRKAKFKINESKKVRLQIDKFFAFPKMKVCDIFELLIRTFFIIIL